MNFNPFSLILLSIICFVSFKVRTVRSVTTLKQSSIGLQQEEDLDYGTNNLLPENIQTVSTKVISKRKPYYSSTYTASDGNYYEVKPNWGSYKTKYADPLLRTQRYVHPDYLGENLYTAAASSSGHTYPSPYMPDSSMEPFVAASHSHGHGHGWKSHTNHKISAVNTDAIGLLGLLGLLAILQSVLLALTTTTTTTTAATGRRKRSTGGSEIDVENDRQMFVNDMSKLILPSLNIVAQARSGKIPVRCTFTEICRANQLLVARMGTIGRIASYKITQGIQNLLLEIDPTDESISQLVKKSASKGRNFKSSLQCEKMYPVCNELGKDGVYALPVLLPKSHPFYYDHQRAKHPVK